MKVSEDQLNYQWFGPTGVKLSDKQSKRIAGATETTLEILNVQSEDCGDYRVLVSNNAGESIISAAATLSLSTRKQCSN